VFLSQPALLPVEDGGRRTTITVDQIEAIWQRVQCAPGIVALLEDLQLRGWSFAYADVLDRKLEHALEELIRHKGEVRRLLNGNVGARLAAGVVQEGGGGGLPQYWSEQEVEAIFELGQAHLHTGAFLSIIAGRPTLSFADPHQVKQLEIHT
jgi:hypothetical protein